jgi:hypothetical protein
VPNHTGLDHPWLLEHPEYYVNGTKIWFKKARGEFFKIHNPAEADDTVGLVDTTAKEASATAEKTTEKEKAAREEIIIAHGRDPYFPGWIDTAQLNAFSQGYRQAAVRTLREIAAMADGVRCDMAMLVMNDIFSRTWGWLGLNQPPKEDFWPYVIPRVKEQHPDFLFIAETYWNMEFPLLEQGFDYTYDKTMYDRLLEGNTSAIFTHLSADGDFLRKQMRFIENHDEKRANDTLGLERSRAAAVLICTTPGATLLHDGQFTGRIIKLPVHITRQPYEFEYHHLKNFYMRLLREAGDDIYQYGEWTLFNTYKGCDGCIGAYNLIAYGWRHEGDLRLIILNFSGQWSQGMIDLHHWGENLSHSTWRLTDVLHQTYRVAEGVDIVDNGLMADMNPYEAVIYHFTPLAEHERHLLEFAGYAQ